MNRGVPTDIKSVIDAVDERRDDSLGAVGVWLRDHLKVTRNGGDLVVLDELWVEAVKYFGEDADGKIEGVDRQEAWRKARAAVKNLPKARTVRRKRTWQGVKFQDEAIEEGEIPEYCERCGVSYYPPDTCECQQDRDGGPPPAAPAADGGDLSGQGGFEGLEQARGPLDFYIPPDLFDIYRDFTRPRPVVPFDYEVERYGRGLLGMEIERRLAVLRVTEGELRAAGNPDLFLLLKVERLRKGLTALRDMHPDAILSPEHVAALRGVEVLVDILQFSMEQVKVGAMDWRLCLVDLRAEAVRRHKEVVVLQERQASRLNRLAGFTLAPLRWLAVRLPRR